MSEEGGGIKMTHDALTPFLQGLLTRSKSMQAALARIYPMYQAFQTDRFQTEGGSEGLSWPDYKDPKYAEYKLRRYGGGPRRKSKEREAGQWQSFPGGGRKMLIGTSTLAGAVIGPGAPFDGTGQHRVLTDESSINISVEMSGTNAEGKPFDYATYVAQERDFMTFSDDHIEQMRETLQKYLIGQ